MTKLLLTGANGFTGLHLTDAAKTQGLEVQALNADILDVGAIEEEILALKPDYVVHLAAISAVTHQDPLGMYRVNVFGTTHLLQALSKLSVIPRKVILASSANVYGNVLQSPISEAICPAPVNHYAMTKLAMEHMGKTYQDKLPIIITRPFNYTGKGHDERFVIPKIVRHFAQNLPLIELGNLQVEREFNDVRAVCEIYLKLLQYGQIGETYNICSGHAISLQTVLDTLIEMTGHQPTININPNFVRANEIHKLCGSPIKLENCIGKIPHPMLSETLQWMLEADHYES